MLALVDRPAGDAVFEWRFDVTLFEFVGAAGGKGAASGEIGEKRWLPTDGEEAIFTGGGDTFKEGVGVGVSGFAEDLGHGAGFNDSPGIKHADSVGDAPDDPDVVADEGDGGAFFGLELIEKAEDLGLESDVEGRCGLVTDEDFGFGDKGDGDDDALALSAGHLVRVFAG